MVEQAGTDMIDDRGKPALAPLHAGVSRIARNLETNRPTFEGVDTESLQDMVNYASAELQDRDRLSEMMAFKNRPDLDAFNKLLSEATGRETDAPF